MKSECMPLSPYIFNIQIAHLMLFYKNKLHRHIMHLSFVSLAPGYPWGTRHYSVGGLCMLTSLRAGNMYGVAAVA